MALWFESENIFNELDLVLEDSNEDDMTLDPDDGPDEDSTQSTDNSNEEPTEEGDDPGENQTDENNEENADDTTDDNSNTDEEDNAGEDDDMSLDPDEDPEGGDESDAGSGEEGTDDGMGDDSTEGSGEEEIDENDPNARLKELEKSIFDQLSKEQKTLKTKELKSLYDVVYNKCTDIINTISGADRSPEQAKVYDYVMNSLTDLQKYIKDYLMQIFDSKTYIENMVQLQKYLTVLDTVSNIFDEVKKSSDMQNTTN